MNAALVLAVIGGGGAAKGHAAASCADVPEMKLSHLQGTVYGPSGVPVPQILVKVMRDGTFVAQAQTDNKGRFEFRVAPGNVNVRVQFLGSRSLDLPLRIVRSMGLFRSPRLRIVLALSGTRCSFATTSNKEFKNQIRRFNQQLQEAPTGP